MADNLKLISAEELMGYRRVDASLPRRGPKENNPDGSERLLTKLNNLYHQQNSLLQEKRVAKLSNLAVGAWNPCKELVEVKVEKGKFWQTMGYHSGGEKYLYAEEGLFLLEMNCMELTHHGVPLTMQEAYELMIPGQFSLEHYQVYIHLMRLGYITTRHKENDITDYEYRIRLHQYRHNQKKVYHKVQGWFQQMSDEADTDKQEERMDRYGDETAPSSLPDGQQASNDTSSSSFAGVSSRTSNDQATATVTSSSMPQLPGSETSSILDNLPTLGDNSSLYSDSPILVQPVKQDEYFHGGATVNLLNYHEVFMQNRESDDHLRLKRRVKSSGTDVLGKRCKMEVKEDLIYYSDSGRDSSVESSKETDIPLSSDDLPNRCSFLPKELTPLQHNFQIEKENFDKKPRPSHQTPWESSDLGVSQLSFTHSINIDDVLDTFLPALNDDPMSGNYSSWNFHTIQLPNLARDGQTDQENSPSVASLPKTGTTSAFATKTGLRHCTTVDEKAQQLMKTSPDLLKTSAEMITTSGKMLDNVGGTSAQEKGTLGPHQKTKLPANWGEYKKLLMMEDKSGGREEAEKDLHGCPAAHLWQGDVKPLVRPSDATTTGNLFNRLQVVCNANLVSEHVRLSPSPGSNVKLAFDVFLPSPNYKKTQPGRPKFHVVVTRVTDLVPDILTLAELLQQASAITLLVAVVDNGDITFYTLKGIELSTDIMLG